jgi:hypothetical protein
MTMTPDEMEQQIESARKALLLVSEVFSMFDVLISRRNVSQEYQEAATRFREIQMQLNAFVRAVG